VALWVEWLAVCLEDQGTHQSLAL